MEFFPAQPDLSLKISPPNTQNTSKIWQTSNQTHQDHGLNMGHFLNTLSSQNHHHGSTTRPDTPFGLYVPFPPHSNESNLTQITNTTNLHDQYHHQQLGFLSPVNGAPIYYQNTPQPNNFHMLAHQYHHQQNSQPSLDSCNIASSTSSSSLSHGNSVCHIARSRFLSATRYPGKRSARAPRMRWTTTLHARFVHAVELLGGHERATPKSVLELMDVKDLTLAHVKSHLQMFRTIKTTDKALVSSGQSEVYENGSSADNYGDMYGIQNQSKELLAEYGGRPIVHQDKEYGLWGNSSSREVLLHGKHGDFEANMPSLEEMNLKGTKNERSSEVSSSSHSETSLKKPNLEFTLGSAH